MAKKKLITPPEPDQATSEMSMPQKQEYAKLLFLGEVAITQKEIAARVGVSENTLSSWVEKFNWKKLKTSLLTMREKILSDLYEELDELNEAIKAKEKGARYADSKQANARAQLTADIKKLEAELSIADKAQAYKDLIVMARAENPADAKTIQLWADTHIKSLIK